MDQRNCKSQISLAEIQSFPVQIIDVVVEFRREIKYNPVSKLDASLGGNER